MDFTREPIIETVITPKEGCKLVVRSSKSTGQEEYFVDAVEVVSFGNSLFFRSTERPKAFLVPVSDYEILEVREARMVLKNVGIDRAIKIGGGRDAQMRTPKEVTEREKIEKEKPLAEESVETPEAEPKIPEKKRDRRRQYRRRRGREGAAIEGEDMEAEGKEGQAKIELPEPRTVVEGEVVPINPIPTPSILTSLLPPPPTLISETIARYKDNALFRDAFYSRTEEKIEGVHIHETPEEGKGEEGKKEDEERAKEDNELMDFQNLEDNIPIPQPDYGTYEMTEQEEEAIYLQRKRNRVRTENAIEAHKNLMGHENMSTAAGQEGPPPMPEEPKEPKIPKFPTPEEAKSDSAPNAEK